MLAKQKALISLLNTFQELLNNTLEYTPPDLNSTLDEVKIYIKNSKIKKDL